MSMDIQPLRDLNSLKHCSPMGIFKRWIYKDISSEELAGDYLQKISFSIHDLNKVLSKEKFDYEDIVFIICLVDWVRESTNCILKLFKNGVLDGFLFSSQDTLVKAESYFVAIRSFVVAHPLETDRHDKFSLDGTYICLDLFQKDNPMVCATNNHDEKFRFLDYEGMHEGSAEGDFYLKSYSSKYYQNRFFLLIGFYLEDIVRYARLCVQQIYELDKYLLKVKMKNYTEVV